MPFLMDSFCWSVNIEYFSRETTQGIGFYGADKNAPVKQQISIDPSYSREIGKSGTDIFVLGFNGSKDWKYDMVASVLDGFLYAVYTGELVWECELKKKCREETLIQLVSDIRSGQ